MFSSIMAPMPSFELNSNIRNLPADLLSIQGQLLLDIADDLIFAGGLINHKAQEVNYKGHAQQAEVS